ncbi:MAG TPA: hypothetical protein VK859_04820 [bacterium]|jgi:hypothetical protein|nr:hypothetical protein [bacterium]
MKKFLGNILLPLPWLFLWMGLNLLLFLIINVYPGLYELFDNYEPSEMASHGEAQLPWITLNLAFIGEKLYFLNNKISFFIGFFGSYGLAKYLSLKFSLGWRALALFIVIVLGIAIVLSKANLCGN